MKRFIEIFKVLLLISICVGIIYTGSILTVKFSDKEYKSLKEIFLPLLSVFVTAVLSYMIWRANSKSALFAEKMQNQEVEKEKERIIETANKIYFSILSSYEYLLAHYKNPDSLRTMYICSDWIDEIARLKKVFDSDEIKLIFDLFRNMNAINEMKNEAHYQQTLNQYCKFLFISDLIELSYCEQYKNQYGVYDYLTRDHLTVMKKLEKLTEISSTMQIQEIQKISLPVVIEANYRNGQKKYSIEYKKSKIYKMQVYGVDGREIENVTYCSGKITGYMEKYENGILKEKGEFNKGELINGERYNVYYDNNYEPDDDGSDEYVPSGYWDRYMKVQEVKEGTAIIDTSPENIKYEEMC